MNDAELPIGECDVLDKTSLAQYRKNRAKWRRWLTTDQHHAIWKQIYDMVLDDLTFRTLACAAEADPDSVLQNPLIVRGLIQGYAATQGLPIRRLLDRTRGVISLQRLLNDIRGNLGLITREIYVAGGGLPYDPAAAMQRWFTRDGVVDFSQPNATWAPNTGNMAFVPSGMAHDAFDLLAGTKPEARCRTDRIQKQVIDRVQGWLDAREIREVVDWSHHILAHSADQVSHQDVDLTSIAPTMDKVASAQRHIVRATEAISAFLLRGPLHGSIVPVVQYTKFHGLDRGISAQALV
jgi:hypothetical protein